MQAWGDIRRRGAGGAKISWVAFRTLWARGITPDGETGIGAWSEREIARTRRSGVTPDAGSFPGRA
jgi:hypothetical protein